MTRTTSRRSALLTTAGIVFALWSLLGIVAFLGDATHPIALAATPLWSWIAHSVAVFGGLAGAIALLLHRRIARPLFAISPVASLIQHTQGLLMTDVLSVEGGGEAVAPSVDIALGIAEVVLVSLRPIRACLR